MEAWKKISFFLCLFGVLKEFRPSEPYVTKYLTSPPMNLTLDMVSNEVYPVSIYTTMVSLVFVFLLTDFLRYKSVIIFDAVCAVIVFLMLITVRSLLMVQVLEIFYGLFMAAEVAYYTYIYAKVDKSHYQEVSGHTRAAYLVGRAVSGIFSQISISLQLASYYSLNFFSLGGMALATVCACCLPSVTSSTYFGKAGAAVSEEVSLNDNSNRNNSIKLGSKINRCFGFLWKDFSDAFSSFYIVKWMFWWALATCGYYQVLSYVQVLWEEIVKESNGTLNTDYNGAVEASYTLLSAGASYGCGLLTLDWKLYGESILFVCSIIIGVLLFLMSQTNHMSIAYSTYVLYTIVYNGMITIANSELATYLNPDSHGLIFGFTLFMALILQSILTLSVSSLLTLERTKFVVYSSYFIVLGLVFGGIAGIKFVRRLCGNAKDFVPNQQNDKNI